jgi:hypothetical protein
MSHVVMLQTKVHDPVAVVAACQRLNLAPPNHGTAQLYSGEAEGLLVQLPGWQYPVVIDTLSGVVRYDNYQGYWGAQQHLDRFLQLYAVERAKLEARKKGYTVSEHSLQDGSIKLNIIEGH